MLRALPATDGSTVFDLVALLDDAFLQALVADAAKTAVRFELTPQEEAEVYAAIVTNFEHLAKSTLFEKRGMAECWVVATLAALAENEERAAHLEALVEPLGAGLFHVGLVDPDGKRVSVIAGESRDRCLHVTLSLLQRAIVTSNRRAEGSAPYGGASPPSIPFAIMGQLGFMCLAGDARALRGFYWENGVSVRVAAASALLGRYGLQPMRAYTVVGAFRHRTTGEPMLVLHDPWQHSQPAPIPESAIPSIFDNATTGTLRPTG